MKDRKIEMTTNDNRLHRANALIDLSVDEARQDEVKGGNPRIAGGGALKNLAGSNTW